MILNIGRVGLDVELDHPASWRDTRGFRDRETTIAGFIRSTSQTLTDALRTELLAQQGKIIAVSYTLDPHLDGFYILTSVRVESIEASYLRQGLYPFEIAMYRIGNEASSEIQSLLTSAEVSNNHGTVPQYWHAPAIGSLAYNAGSGNDPTEIARVSEDGSVPVYLDIDEFFDPTWSIDPADYYNGAVEVWSQGRLRAGNDMPANLPTDWYMTNGLVEIRPQTYQGTSNGRIEQRWFNGTTWSGWTDIKIIHSNANIIPGWHYVTIIRNDAECCIVRLMRDGQPASSAQHHELNITLRRGAYMGIYTYYFTGPAADHSVFFDSVTASTRPGGDASYIRTDSLVDGNRVLLGTAYDYTADETNGGLVLDDNHQRFPFWLSIAVGDAADASGNGPADQAKQFIGFSAEATRIVRR